MERPGPRGVLLCHAACARLLQGGDEIVRVKRLLQRHHIRHAGFRQSQVDRRDRRDRNDRQTWRALAQCCDQVEPVAVRHENVDRKCRQLPHQRIFPRRPGGPAAAVAPSTASKCLTLSTMALVVRTPISLSTTRIRGIGNSPLHCQPKFTTQAVGNEPAPVPKSSHW
jgi:hypothetical protein